MKEFANSAKIKREIGKFHKILNHRDVVPGQSFKMNVPAYPYVTHINHIIALFISSGYDLIPFQINRAFKAVDPIIAKPVYREYCELTFKYLRNMIFFIQNYTDVDETIKEICTQSNSDHVGYIPESPLEMYYCDIEKLKVIGIDSDKAELPD